ncbi:hypothetical protein B0J13DRAFT_678562 [Dactylonectria estremocensis]|uniref:Uncharacterized protein n=1 Tax=Dactylonectria estremocensis TaxID=1079267 RepID=A0A9P9E694_9HYPO|nr:hypothetical protein B0J13DRAFT_678562 [Dactylonectria estremocensis]
MAASTFFPDNLVGRYVTALNHLARDVSLTRGTQWGNLTLYKSRDARRREIRTLLQGGLLRDMIRKIERRYEAVDHYGMRGMGYDLHVLLVLCAMELGTVMEDGVVEHVKVMSTYREASYDTDAVRVACNIYNNSECSFLFASRKRLRGETSDIDDDGPMTSVSSRTPAQPNPSVNSAKTRPNPSAISATARPRIGYFPPTTPRLTQRSLELSGANDDPDNGMVFRFSP